MKPVNLLGDYNRFLAESERFFGGWNGEINIRWSILAALLILLAGCTFDLSLFLSPPGVAAEQVTSPSGRYTAQLWRCCDIYSYISGFVVEDGQTGNRYQQRISDAPGLSYLAGGISFAWTPSEHYLVIVTDNEVTSHGCDELVVYTGDGSQLVFSSATTTSVCRSIEADAGLSVTAMCPNDDILYDGYRLTPAMGEVEPLGDTPAEC